MATINARSNGYRGVIPLFLEYFVGCEVSLFDLENVEDIADLGILAYEFTKLCVVLKVAFVIVLLIKFVVDDVKINSKHFIYLFPLFL